MNWKNKNKSAWVLVLPDIDEYKFLPVYNAFGDKFLEKLFLLNLKWQAGVFELISKRPDVSSEMFIYHGKKNKIADGKVKTFIKSNLPQIKFRWLKNVRVKSENSSFNAIAGKLPFSDNTVSGEMKSIMLSLLRKYQLVTVWNLESPLLSIREFSHVASAAICSGELSAIKSNQERLMLLSYKKSTSPYHISRVTTSFLPAIYDLPDIRDIICCLAASGSPESQEKAGELSVFFSETLQPLPD